MGKKHVIRQRKITNKFESAVKRAMEKHPDIKDHQIIPYAIEENVWQVMEDLFMASPATRQIIKSGAAKAVGAIYDVGTGKIDWLPEANVTEILKAVEANPKAQTDAMAGH